MGITRKVIYQKQLPVSRKKAFTNVSAAQQKKVNRNKLKHEMVAYKRSHFYPSPPGKRA
ncbi:hypothetical protein ENHY17A_50345 [Moraxellaceae bacterium 17A]|nr:hypothetical protein ENHY17A_50345 [Moraxellaceae bacterium 17A]